jgi:hypothetical protein
MEGEVRMVCKISAVFDEKNVLRRHSLVAVKS